MRTAAARRAPGEKPLITVRERSGPKEMASFRLLSALLRELERISKTENVAKVELLEGWMRTGIEDYKTNGLRKV